MSVLLVGIGNTLRRDDGAGAAIANRFRLRPDCQVLIVHQLLPEHADDLVRCDRVVFVDAALNSDRIHYQKLTPSRHAPSLGHSGDPAWLLGLVDALYGRPPDAWLLTVPATDLGYGEAISEKTREAIEDAIRLLESQITK